MSTPHIDPSGEEQSQNNPDAGPYQRLADSHLVSLAVKDTEIQRQHGHDK